MVGLTVASIHSRLYIREKGYLMLKCLSLMVLDGGTA